MLDEKDLQAIAQLLTAQEMRIDSKLKQQKAEILEESAKQTMVLMESYFGPKFNLLAEKMDSIEDKLTPAEALEDIEDRLDILEATTKRNSREIEKLKKAQ